MSKEKDPNRYRKAAGQNIDPDYVEMVGGISEDLKGSYEGEHTQISFLHEKAIPVACQPDNSFNLVVDNTEIKTLLEEVIRLLKQIENNTWKGH